MQNEAVGHDTDVPFSGYSVAPGRTWMGEDHDEPFQVATAPRLVAARQNDVVGQERASSVPELVMVVGVDQPAAGFPTAPSVPRTTAHQVADAHDTAEARSPVDDGQLMPTFEPNALADVTVATEVPRATTHADVAGHEIPGWPVANGSVPPPVLIEVSPCHAPVADPLASWPVLVTAMHSDGPAHDTAAAREPV
jgi:hypothetical protein